MITQIADFRAEVEELAHLLATMPESGWTRQTQFKNWTINDVVLHLYASDELAIAAARDELQYRALRADVLAKRADGTSMIEESRRRFPSLRGPALLKAWINQASDLSDLLATREPASRLPWSGPDMGLKMFVSARQMETWAHGQEIYDVLSVERRPQARILNIAVLGVKTFGWAFKNRGMAVPAQAPCVRLSSPSGEIWGWNEGTQDNAVVGDAAEFCQVVSQVRNVADTALNATGDVAHQWMSIAQCFAGPPSEPPPPGTRFRMQEMAA